MTAFFFFGTLQYRPLFDIVLGPDSTGIDIAADRIWGYRCVIGETDHSAQFQVAEEFLEGLSISGLTQTDWDRISFFASVLGYERLTATTASGLDVAFFSAPAVAQPSDHVWELDHWVSKWGDMAIHAAREIMPLWNKVDVNEAARRLPRIQARAWASAVAAQTPVQDTVFHGRITVEQVEQTYSNFFAVNEFAFRHERFDGTMSDRLERATFVVSDAAFVLPYDPGRDRVLLIEQARTGPLMRGDPNVWQLEAVAGMIDPGETAEETALREAKEEAGLLIDRLEPVALAYPSSGASSEFFHIFVGLCDLPDTVTGVAGAAGEGENIRSHLVSFADLMRMVETRACTNLVLTTIAYWLAHHRSRLRALT